MCPANRAGSQLRISLWAKVVLFIEPETLKIRLPQCNSEQKNSLIALRPSDSQRFASSIRELSSFWQLSYSCFPASSSHTNVSACRVLFLSSTMGTNWSPVGSAQQYQGSFK